MKTSAYTNAFARIRSIRMNSASVFALVGALVCVPAAFVYAQSATPAPAAPKAGNEVVTVTGNATNASTSIDRKTYKVSGDLAGASGSVNDVLRNLPSVDVDILGNVSLRGDTSVTVLIDGKPSTMLSTNNRAAVMEQMPASSIDSIEVMTNPSAQYKPDGSSGIINIITKKNQATGFSGTATANLGSEGRYNLGGSASYRSGGLTISANGSYRVDTRKRIGTDARVRHSSGGDTTSHQNLVNVQGRKAIVAAGSVTYDFDGKNRINAGYSFNQRTAVPSSIEHNSGTNNLGVTNSDYDRVTSGTGVELSTQASAGYRYTFDDKGEFNIDLRRGQTHENSANTYVSTYRIPAIASTTTEQLLRANSIESEFTAEYSGPLWGGKLKTGYDLQQDHNDFNNYGGSVVAGVHTSDPTQTNHFIYGQTIHAGYATYELGFGDFNVLGGLRLEQTLVSTNQVTSSLINKNNYFRAYPSLHLEYDLGGNQIVSLSYSHRVARPDSEDVNPYPVYQDAFNVRAGNPFLLPQETHSLEGAYETKLWGANLAATAYWRQSFNGITDVSTFISPTVLQTTKQNLGENSSGGVEFTANGKIGTDLAFNLAGNVFYNEINASALALGPKRSAGSYTVKASFDYSLTPQDLLQISGTYSGRRLTAQGYRMGSGTLNLGYRHKLSDELSVVATVSDILNSQYSHSVNEIPTLSERNDQHSIGRVVFLGLSWTFGGKPARDQFDYGAGGSGGG